MSGVKGRSGRKRSPTKVLEYFNSQFDLRSTELVDSVLNRAINGDSQMLMYVFDRRLGKPKQTTEIEGADKLGAAMISRVYDIMEEKRKQIPRPLEYNYRIEGGIDVQRQREGEGSQQGEDAQT